MANSDERPYFTVTIRPFLGEVYIQSPALAFRRPVKTVTPLPSTLQINYLGPCGD
jgi:hypothetical protein